jgi:predicted glutamine amidotransferase
MCGIFGHSGRSPKKVSIDKLNILGIWNEERGTDSCGLSMDGDILKGVKSLSQYRDFISHYNIESPQVVPVVIGHTRKSTVGAHTLSNAHPFGFGKLKIKDFKNPGYEFIGVHNGTLLNHKEFATKRKIELEKTVNIKVKVSKVNEDDKFEIKEETVKKIDSELLLECLYFDEDYSVLSEYNGAAALIWTDLNKPNTVFYYHGKSVSSEGDKETKEERPLYYWKETRNSLYVSSIADSLYGIGGDADTVDMFDHNTVYEVTDGNIEKAIKTVISREKNYQKESYPNYGYGAWGHYGDRWGHHNNYHNGKPTASVVDAKERKEKRNRWKVDSPGMVGKTYHPKIGSPEQIQLNLQVPVDTTLLEEEFDLDQATSKGITQMKQLRYWRNGHLTDGVFGYIDGHGYYFLGISKTTALNALKLWAGVAWSKRMFHTVKTHANDAFIPFKKEQVELDPDSFLHYMHEGIRYRNHLDWLSVKQDAKKAKRFGITELSMISAHPIIDLNLGRNRAMGVYYRGVRCNGIFAPLGSTKKYKFRFGELTNISFIPGYVPDALTSGYKQLYTLKDSSAFLAQSIDDEKSKPSTALVIKEVDLLEVEDVAYVEVDTENLCDEGESCKASLDTKLEEIIKAKKVDKVSDIIDELELNETEQLNDILINHFHANFENFPGVLKELRKLRKNSVKAEIAYKAVQAFLASCSAIVSVDMEINRLKNKK